MKYYDIAIIGGGYLGVITALALKAKNFNVAIIHDKEFIPLQLPDNIPCRLFAIAKGSLNIFNKLGINIELEQYGMPISQIRVVEGDSNHYMDFNPKDIGEDNFGIMVEEKILYNQLYEQLKDIDIYEHQNIIDIECSNANATIETSDSKLAASLVIITDGKRSYTRDLIGIETFKKAYNQIAVIADISHEVHHEGVAVERFLSSGPFAILPKKGGFESSIVWTLDDDYATTLKHLPKPLLTELIQERMGDYLGKVDLKTDIALFPLELVYAKEYYGNRCVLLGDALHSIHPLAGQGLNLCLRDLEVLYEAILEARSLGLDFASKVFLNKYHKARKADNTIMIELTGCLNFLFSNDIPGLKLLRKHGLSAINDLPFLKKIFMRYASGLSK